MMASQQEIEMRAQLARRDERIKELENQLAERVADDVRLEWLAANPILAKDIFWNIHPGQEKFLRGEIDYRMQKNATNEGRE